MGKICGRLIESSGQKFHCYSTKYYKLIEDEENNEYECVTCKQQYEKAIAQITLIENEKEEDINSNQLLEYIVNSSTMNQSNRSAPFKLENHKNLIHIGEVNLI